jgi:CRISPR-associated endoribonuclease Cas6
MRIHVKTTPSTEIIPFNYQNVLTGTLHKWIGPNNIHDTISDYSFSWLNGGSTTKKGIRFYEGASFFISAYSSDLIKSIVKGIRVQPEIAYGLKVSEIIIQENPSFGESGIFHPASPVFIKRNKDGRDVHYTYEDVESNEFLTETLRNKLKRAGLSFENVIVEFDTNYRNRKIKTIYYNKIGNKVNMSSVKISGTPDQLAFAWNVGVGNSTGIGFGALK